MFWFLILPNYKKGCQKGEITDLDVFKASQENDMPTKIVKENGHTFSNFIYQIFHNMTDVCIFPTFLKLANMSVFKKEPKNSKEKYRPVRIVSNIKNLGKLSVQENVKSL